MAPDNNQNNTNDNDGVPLEKKTNQKAATKIGDFLSVEDFMKNGLVEVMQATKAINAFPQGATRDVYCAQPDFGRVIDTQLDEVLGVISLPLKLENIKGNIQRRAEDDQMEMMYEFNDSILERINSNLDVLAGLKKGVETIEAKADENTKIVPKSAGSWNAKRNKQSNSAVTKSLQMNSMNIERPQSKFPVPVDNSGMTPFIPKLKEKPNSLKPLAILPEYDEAGNVASYTHPYEFELMKFEVGSEQLKPRVPEKPPALNVTEYIYVDTVPKLKAALEELRKHKEIAIDVEHHSYRSFLGFTCLVQMSTREKDYLFDALTLREDMHILNEVLTDTKIVKIFHGADLDICWLQRDLSLYIVNMFDTHQAAKALNFSRLSLAYLLKHYCDIEADKTFQLADWRIRPLPEELITYARQDTHFLIYIFESISNDLLNAGNQQSNLLRAVYERSTDLCKKRYEKPSANLETHLDMYHKSKRIFNNRQLYALREIFHWRDVTAREEDESYGYVLPNHMLLQIAENLPREVQGIIACCNPLPTLVKRHLHFIHEIILKAREQPLIQPIIENNSMHRLTYTDKTYKDKLYCPHDVIPNAEADEHLPCLLDLNDLSKSVDQLRDREKPEMTEIQLALFKDVPAKSSTRAKVLPKIITPYQRYVAILPLVEKEKLAEAAQEAENIKNRQLCPAETTLLVKQEKDAEEQVVKAELPKRKHEHNTTEESTAKRIKMDHSQHVKQDSKNGRKRRHSPDVEKRKDKNDTDTDSDSGPEEMPSTSQTAQQKLHARPGKRQKRQKHKRQKAPKCQQFSTSAVQTNFNYQKVDFSKFQGGAQRAMGTQIKPQFHGKSNSNKAQNKKYNKLFTFSNVKGGKK